MNINKFYEKAWSKKNTLELRRYISYAIDEINKRDYNERDAMSKIMLEKLKEEVTGTTRKGKISKRTIGKQKGEIIYEARRLHDFLEWDYTSNEAEGFLRNKYKEQWLAYNKVPGRIKLSEEDYQSYVELVFAFKDTTKGFSSDQIKEYFETVNGSDKYSIKDLVNALAKASKDRGLTVSQRQDRVYEYLTGVR